MSLFATADNADLRVLKRAPGTTWPAVLQPDAEDMNRFNYHDAKVFGSWDTGLEAWHFVLVDCTTYMSS